MKTTPSTYSRRNKKRCCQTTQRSACGQECCHRANRQDAEVIDGQLARTAKVAAINMGGIINFMPREIKFRAWDKDETAMSHPFGLQDRNIAFDSDKTLWFDDLNNDQSVVVMQYTGLKDKNGKEIYEGDILDNWGEDGESEKMEVVFNVKIGQWFWGKGDGNSLPLYELDPEETVIIGNIYENTELLTK